MHLALAPGHPLNAVGPMTLALLGVLGALTALAALAVFAGRAGRPRVGVLVVGLVGLLAVEFSFLLVLAQTGTVQGHAAGTVSKARRFGEPQRVWAMVGLIGAPILFAVAAVVLRGDPERDREEEFSYYWLEGLKNYFRDDNPAALIAFTAAIQTAPDRAEPYCKRGSVFERMGQHDLALADCERALARDPNLSEAYLQRGIVRTARGEFDLALADFDRADALRPGDAGSLLQRGICLARKGAVIEAIAEFEKVLRKTNAPEYAEPALRYLRELGAAAPTSPRAEPPSLVP